MELAELGRGRVSPNPMVGAVLFREADRDPEGEGATGSGAGAAAKALPGELIGEGYHAQYGGPHAERSAIENCARRGNDPRGATMAVTLEPCAHTGRQPPCVEAIVEAGVSRVVIASDDPTAKAAGTGPRLLAEAGVEVVWAERAESSDGLRASLTCERARLLNAPFRKHARTGRPLVIFKSAVSLDGRVATASGDSKWISSPESRELSHRMRAEVDAIAVGSGTALADDPLLTARPAGVSPLEGRPLRVVFDSKARLGVDSNLVGSLDAAPLLVAVGSRADAERVEGLRQAGAEVLASTKGSAAVDEVLDQLGERGITSLILEGGPRLAGAFLGAGEIDEVRLFVAPILLGSGPAAIEGHGPELLADAMRGKVESNTHVGQDVLIRARLRDWS